MSGKSAATTPIPTDDSDTSDSLFRRDPRVSKYAQINGSVVLYPRMKNILARIEECRELSRSAREPECLLILGQSGVGKTTIKGHYLSEHPREERAEGTVIPVLAATIPVPANMKTMATALLSSIGDPLALRGTLDQKTHRLYKLIRECRVEMIILDEFQHFIDRDNERVLRSVSDWLKNLISETKVPVVLTGLPSSRRVLEANDQLRRRFSCQCNLGQLAYSFGRVSELNMFLRSLEQSLPLEPCGLDSIEMATRMACATRGNIAKIMKIVRGAAYLAVRAEAASIDLKMLEESYATRVLSADGEEQSDTPRPNPFHQDWTPPERFSPVKKVTRAPKPARKKASELKREVASIFSGAEA